MPRPAAGPLPAAREERWDENKERLREERRDEGEKVKLGKR